MPRTRKRLAIAGVVLLGAAAAATSMAILMSPGSASSSAPPTGELPTAVEKHMAKVRQAAPGNAGMAPEGPGSAAAYEYMKRAYPDSVISVSDMRGGLRAASTKRVDRSNILNHRNNKWHFAGPSEALYPFEPIRNWSLYVPNAYVAAGRTTAIAIDDRCNKHCTAYVTAAGGGLWKTDDVFANHVNWDYLGGPLGINAAGAVTFDPNDVTRRTIYIGTGEANICGSGCVAGAGLYKSTNEGRTWTKIGDAEFTGKGIGSIVVKPGDSNTIYAGTTTALRGISSVCCAGVTRPVPGAAKWGLYKTTNGGASWSFIHNGSANPADCTGSLTEFGNAGICSPRGVRDVEIDPQNSNILYASSYARGVWRTSDAGATWTQIKPSINAAVIQSRAAIDVTRSGGATRMYVYEGNAGQNTSRLSRSDSVDTGAPVFIDLTSPSTAAPGFAWHGNCDPQCWYDIFVHTPQGHPNVVYVGGDYSYGEMIANKRGVVLSTDAGVSGTDMTFDGTNEIHPNGIHPDQHDIATHPRDPFKFVETGDGGVIRSEDGFVDRSSWCANPDRGPLNPTDRARCEQMLSRIPRRLEGINKGMGTLQFMSLSVSPHNIRILQGGTQDNGTWEGHNYQDRWLNTIVGDGGQSGFDVDLPDFRFHNYFDATTEVSFDGGEFENWIWVADDIFGHAGTQFYAPVISDPVVSKTLFAGTGRTAYRTKTAGLGTMTMEEAQELCNSWTGTAIGSGQCGDFEELNGAGLRLSGAGYGADRQGGVSAIERTTDDTSTAWAANIAGRVFISKNVDTDPASAVTWTRLDDDFATSPNRFVSSIYVDPEDGNHAWISYSGYNANTPATPGHLFEVTYNPVTGTSTWTNIDHNWGDLPVNDLVRDDASGDLYAATDFGVMTLEDGDNAWERAGRGLPNVEVAGLTVVSGRRLFAATHGLSAWYINLHHGQNDDDD